MKLSFHRFTIHPKVPFAIARGSATVFERVLVRLRDDALVEGWGEAAPNAYYRESADTAEAALPQLGRVLERSRTVDSLQDIDILEEWMRTEVRGDASARAAVSMAAHDLLGKKRGQPLWKVFGVDPMLAPTSSFTIPITTDDAKIRRRVEDARRYPVLKIKLGSDRDEWIVRIVRQSAPDKVLRADANAAWNVDEAIRMSRFLADNGFELIEQPLARDDIEGFRTLRAASPIPVIADESCVTATDIPALEGAVHGINIKLSKCGGLAEARRMIAEARRRDMKVMLGCMIESSLGITAAAHLAPLVDYADLDGAALLADDPYVGATIDDGMIRLPAEPGLGVRLRD
jgi:L-alanine-DL-glutamate epimerase-like enolase superfamily enzyme